MLLKPLCIGLRRFLFKNVRPVAIVCSICIGLLSVNTSVAATACPQVMDVAPPDGIRIQLRARGDEFFAWHETADTPFSKTMQTAFGTSLSQLLCWPNL